jgi:hypothetical protein
MTRQETVRLAQGLVLMVAGSLVSCTGLSARVDRSALANVPNEELLLLFDAENAVYIARDEADMASRHLVDARAALTKAQAYRGVVAARRTSGATIDSMSVLDLLGQWNDARIAMREAELAWREVEWRTCDLRLWAARAHYELEKARLVKAKNPAAGTGVDLARFESQDRDWHEREQQADASVAVAFSVVTTTRARYFELSRLLQEQSNGAYGGPWADLLD